MRKEGDKFPLRMLLLISQIGITMMVPIFFCGWLGSLVARKTGIDILILVFSVIGIMAGFRSCYHIIRRFTSLKSSTLEDNYPGTEPDSGMEDHIRDDHQAGKPEDTYWDDDPENRPENPWN